MRSRTTTRVGISLAAVALGSATAAAGVATAAPSHPSNTFSSAYAVKTSHAVGKRWKVEVVKIIRNANAACNKADHDFYHAPKKGYTWVVVDYKYKKLSGGPKQMMGTDIITDLISKSGKQYGEGGVVAPNDASGTKPIGKGQSVTGAFVYQVKNGDIKHIESASEDDMTLKIEYFKV